jgi:hypothetical protein
MSVALSTDFKHNYAGPLKKQEYRANYSTGAAGTNLLDFATDGTDFVYYGMSVYCGGLDDITKRGWYSCIDGTLANIRNAASWHYEGLTYTGIISALGFTPVNKIGDTMTGFLTLNADPTSALHAATKNYVDGMAVGIIWTDADALATINITLSGEQTIDGFTTSGSTILVIGQTDQTQNGFYTTAAGVWTRSSFANTGAKLIKTAAIIKNGTVNANTNWANTNTAITVGTTNITFTKISGISITNGTGLSLAGNVMSLDLTYTDNRYGIINNLTNGGGLTFSYSAGISKYVMAIDPATVGDVNTGTNNAKPITALGLAGSQYLTQAGNKISATASGTNTYIATITPAITAITAGMRFYIKFTNANTGASTINLNGLGAIALTKNGATPLAGGEINTGQIVAVSYDGTSFQIVGGGSGGGASVTAANPSQAIGLAVVNGSAATFMRSDAAPALDVSISPTWTGTHTFSNPVTVAATASAAINHSSFSTKGFLFPQGTSSTRGGITGVEGLIYQDTTLKGITSYNGAAWALQLGLPVASIPASGVERLVTVTGGTTFPTVAAPYGFLDSFAGAAGGGSTTTASNLSSATWTGPTLTYTGIQGEERSDNTNYYYQCVSTNTWVRIPIGFTNVDVILGSINDASGIKTSAYMASNYATAQTYQIVTGVSGFYQYYGVGLGWLYIRNAIRDEAIQTLAFNATLIWDVALGLNAKITLTGNVTSFTINNARIGTIGTLAVTQDATGGRTIVLPTGSKVTNGGAGSILLTSTASAIDILSFYYDGTNYFWSYGTNFS